MSEVGAGWWAPLPSAPPGGITVQAVDAAAILPLRVRVLRVGRPDLSASFALDDGPATLHLAAVDELGDVVGTVTVFPEEPPAPVGEPALPWLRLVGMAVTPEAQSRGVGGLLLSVVLEAARDFPIWATARDAALSFYERHGFTTLPGGFATAMGIPHHHVVRHPLR